MQILVIPSWYSTPQYPYTGSYVKKQCEFIKKKEIEVHLMYADLGPSGFKVPFKEQFQCSSSLEGNILTYRMPGFLLPKNNRFGLKLWLKYYEQLFNFYVSEQGRPELIHAHSFLAGYLAAHLKSRYNIPYILTEHSGHFIDSGLTSFQKRLIHTAFAQANQLIAVSEVLRSKMQSYTQKGIVVIPNLVDTSLFRFTKSEKNRGETFNFFFVGSLIDNKQPLQLLEAFSMLQQKGYRQIALHFVGQGPLSGKLEANIQSLELQGSVFVHGTQTSSQIAQRLANAQALVLPSKAETFGIVLIEAMACGLPVIATRCGGPEFIVEKDTGVLVPVGDTPALVRAMEHLLHHYQEYEGEKISQKAKIRYGGESVAASIIKLYKATLATD